MKRIILIAFVLLRTHSIYSQETITTSGGEATGNGTVSYSVGQIVYTTHTGSSGSTRQGVQQSIELSVLSNPEVTAVTLSAITYPNPTSNYVVLSLKDMSLIKLSYALYDLQAREVSKGNIQQEETKIAMQILATGTYLLKVNQKNQTLKSFKIIKN